MTIDFTSNLSDGLVDRIVLNTLSSAQGMNDFAKSFVFLAQTCKTLKNYIDTDDAGKKISSIFLSIIKKNSSFFMTYLKPTLALQNQEYLEKIAESKVPFLKQVRHLDLSATAIKSAQLQAILNQCGSLETLDLDGCLSLGDIDLTNQPELRTINLSVCPSLGDIALPITGNLRTINLNHCGGSRTLLDLTKQVNLKPINPNQCGYIIALPEHLRTPESDAQFLLDLIEEEEARHNTSLFEEL